MEAINQLMGTINGYMYGYILIALLIFTGLYFTFRTGFVQLTMVTEAFRMVTEKVPNRDGVSSFEALMISTASRVGTGNIAGVATALAAGGYGAIFWMWALAIVGSASAFIESTLAQIYKIDNKDKTSYLGGPAYYIEMALGQRWLGVLFAVLLIICYAVGFNALQAYNAASAFEIYASAGLPIDTLSAGVGIFLAACTAFTIFGGTNRIGIITSIVVPFMAVLYMLLSLYITITNINLLPDIFARIFAEAFDFQAIFGGFMGSAVMYGIKRGLFSNEAGMGSAPNAAATAEVSHPVKQGLVQMLSVYIDTLVLCTTTAMMLLVFGVKDGLTGMPYVQAAVSSQVGEWGMHFIAISILLFAFSSLVGNYCYAEINLKFIKNDPKLIKAFRIFCVIVVFLGSIAQFDTVWNLADALMGLMAIVNIVAILLLGGTAIKALKDYKKQKIAGKNPEFNALDLGITNTSLWKGEKEYNHKINITKD